MKSNELLEFYTYIVSNNLNEKYFAIQYNSQLSNKDESIPLSRLMITHAVKRDFTVGLRNTMNLLFLDQICLQNCVTSYSSVSIGSLNIKVGDKLGYAVTLRNDNLLYYLINLSLTTLPKMSKECGILVEFDHSKFSMDDLSVYNNLERKFDKWSSVFQYGNSGVTTVVLPKYSYYMYAVNALSHLGVFVD